MAKRKQRNRAAAPAGERPLLNRDQILRQQLRTKKIFVEEWDGYVYIKEMSAQDMQANANFALTKRGETDMAKAVRIPARIACRQVVDEAGGRVFTDHDIQQLERLNHSAISYISEQVNALSGIEADGDGDEELAKLTEWLELNYGSILAEYKEEQSPVTAAEENFDETPNDDSPTT